MNPPDVKLARASVEDAEEVLSMQRLAFRELLEKYQDYDTSPACQTLERLRSKFQRPGLSFYFILCNGEKAGAICVVDTGEPGVLKRVSPLFILPGYRRRGIARAAMQEAERLHGAHGWSLDTIAEEPGNCRLYEGMGYRRIGEPRKVNERMTLVDYRKD